MTSIYHKMVVTRDTLTTADGGSEDSNEKINIALKAQVPKGLVGWL